MILAAALRTTVGQLAARHGHKRALGSFDDLQIANDEGIVERHRAEGLQTLVIVLDELDANFSDLHSCSPFFLWHTQTQLRTRNILKPTDGNPWACFLSPCAIRSASHRSRHRAKR